MASRHGQWPDLWAGVTESCSLLAGHREITGGGEASIEKGEVSWRAPANPSSNQGIETDFAVLMMLVASSGSSKPSLTRLLAAAVTAATYPALLP
jgi:hypothetical protein